MAKSGSRSSVPALAIIFFILAILFLVLAILFYFEVINQIGNWNIRLFASGLALLGIGLLLNIFNVKRKDSKARTVALVELIVLLCGALVGFILPSFDIMHVNLGTATQWLAIILILHGVLRLTLNKYDTYKITPFYFFLNLFFLILGGYLLGSNIIERNINNFVTIIFAGFAVLMLYYGLRVLKGGKKGGTYNNA